MYSRSKLQIELKTKKARKQMLLEKEVKKLFVYEKSLKKIQSIKIRILVLDYNKEDRGHEKT